LKYVYFFGHAGSDQGPLKIGYTGNLAQRRSTIQTSSPYEIQCFDSIEIDDDEKLDIEALLHTFLQPRRIRGEWFNIKPSEIRLVADLFFHSMGMRAIFTDDEGEERASMRC
jgi:hypothetical protein